MDPRYRGITSVQIPQVVTDKGATVKIICGEYQGVQGPVQDIVTESGISGYYAACWFAFSHRTKRIYSPSLHSEGAGYFDSKKRNLAGEGTPVVYTGW